MKAILVLSLLGLILISSCADTLTKTKAPADLIAKDTFVSALRDLYTLEGYFQNQFVQMNEHQPTIKKSGDALLAKYAISHDRFQRSLEFYAADQESMLEINNQILDSLNLELSKAQ
jgi:hypothetical protein